MGHPLPSYAPPGAALGLPAGASAAGVVQLQLQLFPPSQKPGLAIDEPLLTLQQRSEAARDAGEEGGPLLGAEWSQGGVPSLSVLAEQKPSFFFLVPSQPPTHPTPLQRPRQALSTVHARGGLTLCVSVRASSSDLSRWACI